MSFACLNAQLALLLNLTWHVDLPAMTSLIYDLSNEVNVHGYEVLRSYGSRREHAVGTPTAKLLWFDARNRNGFMSVPGLMTSLL